MWKRSRGQLLLGSRVASPSLYLSLVAIYQGFSSFQLPRVSIFLTLPLVSSASSFCNCNCKSATAVHLRKNTLRSGFCFNFLYCCFDLWCLFFYFHACSCVVLVEVVFLLLLLFTWIDVLPLIPLSMDACYFSLLYFLRWESESGRAQVATSLALFLWCFLMSELCRSLLTLFSIKQHVRLVLVAIFLFFLCTFLLVC